MDIFLISNRCGRSQATTDGATPGHVVLGGVREVLDVNLETHQQVEFLHGLCICSHP